MRSSWSSPARKAPPPSVAGLDEAQKPIPDRPPPSASRGGRYCVRGYRAARVKPLCAARLAVKPSRRCGNWGYADVKQGTRCWVRLSPPSALCRSDGRISGAPSPGVFPGVSRRGEHRPAMDRFEQVPAEIRRIGWCSTSTGSGAAAFEGRRPAGGVRRAAIWAVVARAVRHVCRSANSAGSDHGAGPCIKALAPAQW